VNHLWALPETLAENLGRRGDQLVEDPNRFGQLATGFVEKV